jgi:DNA polymerase III epsilon subunit-like protein
MTLVFLDTETTGLDRERHQVWEIGAIARTDQGDVEYQWMLRPDLRSADPGGLRIGRYYERMGRIRSSYPVDSAWRLIHPDDPGAYAADEVASDVAQLLDGVTVVGAVPDFDAEILRRGLRRNGQAATWHYHLVDVETFAAGAVRQAPPWGFDDLLAAYGLVYDEADRHTALGDARMVRDLYDAVLAKRD